MTTRPGVQCANASTIRMYLIMNLIAKTCLAVVLCSEKPGIMISTLECQFSDLGCLLMVLSLAVICCLSSYQNVGDSNSTTSLEHVT